MAKKFRNDPPKFFLKKQIHTMQIIQKKCKQRMAFVLVTFPIAVTNDFNKGNLVEKGFVLAHSLRI